MFCLVGFVVFGWLATLLFCTILSPEVCVWSVTTFWGGCVTMFLNKISPHTSFHIGVGLQNGEGRENGERVM